MKELWPGRQGHMNVKQFHPLRASNLSLVCGGTAVAPNSSETFAQILDEEFVFPTSCSVCLRHNELPAAPFGHAPWLFALCRSRLQLSDKDTPLPAEKMT